jgi:transposase
MACRNGQAYSADPRLRVLAASGSAREAAARFGVSVSYVVKARQRRGRMRRRLAGLHDAIATHVRVHTDATLNELRAWLRAAHGATASMGLMWNTLARLGVMLKKRRSIPPSKRAPTLLKPAGDGVICSSG